MSEKTDLRNKKLDNILTATKEYVDAEKARIEREVRLLEAVSEGRGWGNLNMPVINTVAAVAEDDLASYLFGD